MRPLRVGVQLLGIGGPGRNESSPAATHQLQSSAVSLQSGNQRVLAADPAHSC